MSDFTDHPQYVAHVSYGMRLNMRLSQTIVFGPAVARDVRRRGLGP